MFLLRDATLDDLKGLRRLAAVLNTVNLPDDDKALRALLETSTRSFVGKIKEPLEREYLFVMEDTDSGKLVGTSQIIAQHGTRDAPHIYFDVLDEERYSETRDLHFRHKVLRIGFDYDGPTEIGGLVLDPDFRRTPGKLGKQLSFVRFVFIAIHRDRFRDRVLAELLPPLGKNGRSALWEALGRRFTNMDYSEADLISKTNKEFIKNLFPSGLIYASLFDKEAQEVIGRVGPQTEGVKKMLMAVGFSPMGRVDPFDGGPHFQANTEDIWPVVQTVRGVCEVVDDKAAINEGSGESADGLVAFEPEAKQKKKLGSFRCVQTEFRIKDTSKASGKSKRAIAIDDDTREALGCDAGDRLWALPITKHVRM